MPKTYLLSFLSILCTLCLLEGGFYGFWWCLPTHWYYTPPTREAFLRYLTGDIDWTLGWRAEPEALAPGGYRLAPAGEGLTTPCVSLYGDSFTFGYEVAPEFAWGNLLTARLGCRVDNYGVAGYGTDQAYLAFQQHHRHGSDAAPVVILSHLSENIVRNITQDLGFIYQNVLALKPRFVVEPAGGLRLLPLPRLAPHDYEAYRRDLGQFFPADSLLPGHSRLAKRRVFFPYMLSVPLLFAYKRLYASLLFYASTRPPWFAELYDPVHPSQALQITRDILLQFGHEARQYGKRPLIFVIPTARDLLYFQRTQQWSYTPLLTQLHTHGEVEAVNLGPLLLAKVHDGALCAAFCTNALTRSGHYTVQGNKLLAEVAWDILRGYGRVPGANQE